MKLRKYQQVLKDDIRGEFKNDIKSVILCSPTGSGKTVTFADICRDSVANGFKCMVCVDRKELLQQSEKKLIEYGLKPTIITAGVKYYDYNANTYVATVQTLKRRQFPWIDLLVIDEAHKQIFDDVVKFYREKEIFIIGATATPIRKGKNMNQLGDMYEKIIQSVDIAELISDGFLAPARTFGCLVDMDSVKVKKGDYDTGEMFDAYDKPFLYDGLIDKIKQFAPGRKTLIFCVNVEHSKKTCESLRFAGYRSAHVDGTTPKREREMILRDFSMGKITHLCNVDILTTGYDEPTIECVVVNRRTKSVPLWLQMCGRGSRIYPGKNDFIILDMGGNVVELGHWERKRDFSLWHQFRTGGVAPLKQCPDPLVQFNEDGSFEEIERDNLPMEQKKKHGCGMFVPSSATLCPHCQFIFPKSTRKMVDADFTELGEKQAIPEHLQKSYREMSFEELQQICEIKGFKKQWILHQFEPTHENLTKFANFMGYKKSWVFYAKNKLFKKSTK
jgi:superfamily II DNA or RNA helicase